MIRQHICQVPPIPVSVENGLRSRIDGFTKGDLEPITAGHCHDEGSGERVACSEGAYGWKPRRSLPQEDVIVHAENRSSRTEGYRTSPKGGSAQGGEALLWRFHASIDQDAKLLAVAEDKISELHALDHGCTLLLRKRIETETKGNASLPEEMD